MSDKLLKSNLELSEAQKYYIGLFEKWQKWQIECPEKLPVEYRSKVQFDFDKILNSAHSKSEFFTNAFVQLPNSIADKAISNLMILKIIEGWFLNVVIICTHTDEVLKIIDVNFNGLLSQNNNILKKLINLYKNNKLEIISYKNCPELDNLQLQNELEVYKQNNQLSTNRIKVFHFNQTLLGDYKASFAEYFMGLKDFILYSQGKNIGVDIRLNGSLELKIYSDNEQDLDSIRLSINDYVNNLLNPNDEPKIHSGVNAVDPQKALILIKSKLNNLETSLQLKNSQLIANENLVKYLKEVALDIQSKNEELQSQNKQLASQLDETISVINNLKFQLTQIKVKELNSNDQIDIVINLLGTLTLIINQKESTKLTKQIINQLSDFEKVNREFFEKIRLPEVDFKIGEVDLRANLTTISISDLLQQIITKLYRNF